jgi:hypothetical protein
VGTPTTQTIETILRVIAAGASVDFNASAKPTDHLVQVAAAAAGAGVQVTLRCLGTVTPDQLLQIAAAGQRYVTLAL